MRNPNLSRHQAASTRFLLLAALALPGLASAPRPLAAHTGSEGGLPLTPHSLRLQYRRPAEMVALFAREQPPGAADHIPRAVLIDGPESLLPSGAQGLYRTQRPGELVVVATERAADVEACIRELDVPVQSLGPDRQKVVLTLRRAPADRVRATVLRLPEAGSAAVSGRQLTLSGKPTWIHRALRSVIRAELGIVERSAARPR